MEEKNLQKKEETRIFVFITPILSFLYCLFLVLNIDHEAWGPSIYSYFFPVIILLFSIFDVIRGKKGVTFWFIAIVFFILLSIIVPLTK